MSSLPIVDPHDLISQIERMLSDLGINPDALVQRFGQERARAERRAGKTFNLEQHIEAMVFAQLSSERPWGHIEQSREALRQIFFRWNPGDLQSADPQRLENAVKAIKCGNRRLRFQMKALAHNICKLRSIQDRFGTLDAFLDHDPPHVVVDLLSIHGSEYKLHEIGEALAYEYLKNVGVDCAKPDRHLRRLLGSARLGYSSSGTPEQPRARIV